ncbi:hypothetical protein [Spiroplasma endosymbiont of Tricholauxania praeusta]|uniref:hypothetical protein n=1 Tax=Spiroplasma endosymbiont of Tricholauxania praeusta TaxID=3066296 RepID=UPI0030CD7EBC
MINDKDKNIVKKSDVDSWWSITTSNKCDKKIEKLNKKQQETVNELEEISSLYAKSVKESLDKSKKN